MTAGFHHAYDFRIRMEPPTWAAKHRVEEQGTADEWHQFSTDPIQVEGADPISSRDGIEPAAVWCEQVAYLVPDHDTCDALEQGAVIARLVTDSWSQVTLRPAAARALARELLRAATILEEAGK